MNVRFSVFGRPRVGIILFLTINPLLVINNQVSSHEVVARERVSLSHNSQQLFVSTKFVTYTELHCVRTTTAFAPKQTDGERHSSRVSKFIVVRPGTSHELRTAAYISHRPVHPLFTRPSHSCLLSS